MWEANKIGFRGNTSYIRAYKGRELMWEQMDNEYLSFTSSGTSTISMRFNGLTPSNFKVYYSFNRKNWTLWNYAPITLNDGLKVYLYGDNPRGFLTTSVNAGNYAKFVMAGNIYGAGDACYLLAKDISTLTQVPTCGLNSLFSGCSSLITAPNVSLQIGGSNVRMFEYCTSLIKAPEMITVGVGGRNCQYFFRACTSLTESPYIKVVDLDSFNMELMFDGCTSLNKITLESNLYKTTAFYKWAQGVSANGTFYKIGNASIGRGISGIPNGWDVVEM